MNIAVIPARGGSKRIPRKNIRLFNGQPMIAWSIQAARDSGLFDHIVVSTDDREIAEIAQAFGAEVPFLRPPSLADDVTPTVPVIAHAVSACAEMGWAADHVCCLYPCAPFIQAEDLLAGLELLKKTKAAYVYPVAEYAHPVHRAMLRSAEGRMTFLHPEYELTRTQDLPVAYHDTGQFYWGKSTAWSSMKRMHSEGVGLVVPYWRVVDIDTPEDWARAELIARTLKAG